MKVLKQNRAASFIAVTFVYILATAIGVLTYQAITIDWWLSLLVADAAATVTTFIFSLIFQNASVYDPYWSFQPPVILVAFAIGKDLTFFGIFLIAVVSFWAIRLTANWAYTFGNLNHQDWRYKSEREKRKEIPVGIFNAKKTNNPRRTESQGSDCGGYFDDTNYKLRGKKRARFKEMLEDLLSAVPDTLTVNEVAELTGYNRKTILRYVQRKYIYAVNIMGKYYISKQSIINNLATDKAFKNTQKSEWHEETISKYQ